MFEAPTEPVSKEWQDDETAEMLKWAEENQSKAESLRDCGPEVERAEKLMEEFEARHSLADLHAITELTPKQAETHPIRRSAWADERVIVDLVEKIRKETNISKERLEEVQIKRKRISNAVGFIRNNRVEHNR